MMQIDALLQEIRTPAPMKSEGRVVSVHGPVVQARIPQAAIGDLCHIQRRNGSKISAEVVAFSEDIVCLAPFGESEGIGPGGVVTSTGRAFSISVGDSLLGQVIDVCGVPLSRENPIVGFSRQLKGDVPDPMSRSKVTDRFHSGVFAIDALCSLGYGQRIGLFASAGVGKSTLLGMMTAGADVDVTVVALVGERGREVREFVEHSIGAAGMKRAVVVVATSDESAQRRAMAAYTATTIAEHFRSQGKRVLLLVDSLTRTARAMREVGLAAGEVPIRQGFTPSVYAQLPKLLERAGNDNRGSITAVYTVLQAPQGESDPLGEEIKSLLDGHIVLNPALAEKGVRPAIDLVSSISRLMPQVASQSQIDGARKVIKLLARLQRDRDLVLLGGTPDAELAKAMAIEEKLQQLLSQRPIEQISREEFAGRFQRIAELIA